MQGGSGGGTARRHERTARRGARAEPGPPGGGTKPGSPPGGSAGEAAAAPPRCPRSPEPQRSRRRSEAPAAPEALPPASRPRVPPGRAPPWGSLRHRPSPPGPRPAPPCRPDAPDRARGEPAARLTTQRATQPTTQPTTQRATHIYNKKERKIIISSLGVGAYMRERDEGCALGSGLRARTHARTLDCRLHSHSADAPPKRRFAATSRHPRPPNPPTMPPAGATRLKKWPQRQKKWQNAWRIHGKGLSLHRNIAQNH